MKKLYLYIRLSDADDDLKFKTESESIANQRTLLYRFIRARREFDGYEVVEFIDDGYSGTNGNRPSFERMIESLKNGEATGGADPGLPVTAPLYVGLNSPYFLVFA